MAQELFSSHDVDTGSRALLKALDVDVLPETGHVIDYGRGYGVLGLALKVARRMDAGPRGSRRPRGFVRPAQRKHARMRSGFAIRARASSGHRNPGRPAAVEPAWQDRKRPADRTDSRCRAVDPARWLIVIVVVNPLADPFSQRSPRPELKGLTLSQVLRTTPSFSLGPRKARNSRRSIRAGRVRS